MAIPLGNLEHTELRGCRPLFSRSRSFTVTLGASSRRRNRTVGYKGNRLSCPPLLSATPFYPNIHHFQSQPHNNQLTYSSPILSLHQDAIHRRPRSSPDLASRHGSPNVWHYVGYRWGPPTRLVQVEDFCSTPTTLFCCNGVGAAGVAGEPTATATGCWSPFPYTLQLISLFSHRLQIDRLTPAL